MRRFSAIFLNYQLLNTISMCSKDACSTETFESKNVLKFGCEKGQRTTLLKTWIEIAKKSIFMDNDNDNPIDITNPKLDIKLNMLRGRFLLQKLKVTIESSNGESLFNGTMKNGHLLSFVNRSVLDHPGWHTRLKITLISKKLRSSTNTITIYSGMKNGRLQGIVQIFGILTQHPEDVCSESIFDGLSFIGRYDNGKPTGTGWRQLVGGSWMYGLVDMDGQFSGENIAYIYPDLELALVGKFKNGMMVGLVFINKEFQLL